MREQETVALEWPRCPKCSGPASLDSDHPRTKKYRSRDKAGRLRCLACDHGFCADDYEQLILARYLAERSTYDMYGKDLVSLGESWRRKSAEVRATNERAMRGEW